MRILVVQESDWLGVGTHDHHHLLERMSLEGDEVRVIDFELRWRGTIGKGLISERIVKKDVHRISDKARIDIVTPRMILLPVLDYASIPFFHTLEIRKQMEEFRPDIVICLGIINAYFARSLSSRYGVPYVYYVLDELHLLVPQAAFQPLARLIESSNMRKADLVITTNTAMREYAIEMGGKEDRIKIIRHGVIMSEFLGANGEHIRDQLHFEKSDVVLFFMGWLYSFSGIDDVAEQIIAREDSRMKLLVVGKGDLLDKMRKISSMSNGRVVCLNWVDHKRIPEYIAASDICLLPSMKVGIMNRIVPIKMIEYLAAGKPVIATRLEGLVKEFGEDSGVAFIDSTAQVVAKVEELLSNGSITGMSKDATRYASNCDWDDIFLEFEHYLSNLADSFRSR